jgi:hypothetical protein
MFITQVCYLHELHFVKICNKLFVPRENVKLAAVGMKYTYTELSQFAGNRFKNSGKCHHVNW